jgi:hypothetical protein
MKERPILFSGPMVRALLDGTKTQTRRVANKAVRHPDLGNLYAPGALVLEHEPQHVIDRACPYGRPGDRLWVRESFQSHTGQLGESIVYAYRATDDDRLGPWRPSIHMPRVACRLVLEITGLRIERLNDCSDDDALAEGIACREVIVDTAYEGGGHVERWADRYLHGEWPCDVFESAGEAYADLWDSINGAGSWDRNPWVWVVEFKRV